MPERTRRDLLRAASVVAGSATLAGGAHGQSAASGTEWPTFGFDYANRGRTSAVGPKSAVSARWTTETGGAVISSPVVAAGQVIVGSSDGNVYALDALSGEPQWTHETGDRVLASPTVHDGTVYIGSTDSTVYALDAKSGTPEWTAGTGDAVVTAPAVVDGTVYVGSEDTAMYALDASSGTQRWTVETESIITSSPAVHDGRVYFGSADANVYAVDAAAGSVDWTHSTGNGVPSAPAVAGGRIYVGSSDQQLYALDAATGESVWTFGVNGILGSSPAIADGLVYVTEGLPGRRIYSLDAATGDQQWVVETGGSVQSSPAVADGVVYVGSGDAFVYALDAATGDQRWTFETGGGVSSSPAIVDSVVYVGSNDGNVYALSDGAIPQRIAGSGWGLTELALVGLGAVGVGGGGVWAYRRGRSDDGDDTTSPDSPPAAEQERDQPSDQPASASTSPDPPSRPVPDPIPDVEPLSVEYDRLTDREPIGSGGNADVVKATHPTPTGDRVIALKEPRATGTIAVDDIDQLLSEAEVWSKLDDHPHIVNVLDYGAQPLPWIAMEYMDGGTLSDRAGEFELAQALWTALSVTKAVRHAHRRGVAHLDLKPDNVLFRHVDDAWDAPKVGDWGLSKYLLERPNSVEGLSPHYAAPEQFDSSVGPTDDLTDVYQLGAVFYELFTGRPPFEGGAAEVMRAVLETEPTPPSEIADVPPELDDVLLTALEKHRDDRYDDVVYLRDNLQRLYTKS